MILSTDALIFGLGYLNAPQARLSFGGEGALMRITPRARNALDELITAGYAEPAAPDCQTPGREFYQGVAKDPHLGQLAREAGLDPFNIERWPSFERVSGKPDPRPVTGPVPQLLEQPLIPPPLHGLNPRTIMGKTAWDEERRRVYRKYGFTCAACGVNGRDAFPVTRIEAHERFRIDYRARTMELIGMEPVCPACHAFVHGGLLEIRLQSGQVSRKTVCRILAHGVAVLGAIGGTIPQAAHHLCGRLGVRHSLRVAPPPPVTSWTGWRLLWDGQEYPSPYLTEADWRRAMRSA